MKKVSAQDFINILFDRYNNGIRFSLETELQQAQEFVNRMIHTGIEGNEQDEYRIVKELFMAIPAQINKKRKEEMFDLHWLSYGPKFIQK